MQLTNDKHKFLKGICGATLTCGCAVHQLSSFSDSDSRTFSWTARASREQATLPLRNQMIFCESCALRRRYRMLPDT